MTPAPTEASLAWQGGLEDGCLMLVDQRRSGDDRLRRPANLDELLCLIAEGAIDGSSACGVAAGYGLALQIRDLTLALEPAAAAVRLEDDLQAIIARLRAACPGLGGVAWAGDRQGCCFDRHATLLTAREMAARLLMEARRMQAEDTRLWERISVLIAGELPAGTTVLCHGPGEILASLRRAAEADHLLQIKVCAAEAGEATAIGLRELTQAGLDAELCDNAQATALLAQGQIATLLLGARRVAANGDGLYRAGSAALVETARRHKVPVLVAAPASTFSLDRSDGAALQDDGATGADLVTASNISRIVTGRGVIPAPDQARIAALVPVETGEPAV